MLHSKKALSPLIAAVLLIVVVVGIGAVVTGMIRGLVSENQETITSKSDEMACSRDVSLSVVSIDGEPQICRGSNYVDVVLENTGSADVDDFQLVVYGDAGLYRNESLASGTFAQGSALELNGTFESGIVGNIEQIKFVPKLKKSGASGYHFCTDVAITYDAVDTCL